MLYVISFEMDSSGSVTASDEQCFCRTSNLATKSRRKVCVCVCARAPCVLASSEAHSYVSLTLSSLTLPHFVTSDTLQAPVIFQIFLAVPFPNLRQG